MRGILTAIWALLAAALCWFAVYDKAPEIQQDILTKSTEAVAPLNANAEVLVDGRFLTVRGPEPSEETKAKTLAGADDVYGALGPTDALWVPAVTNVLEFLSIEKKADGSVTLTGLTPSDASKAAAQASAEAAFTGAINNQLVVSGSADPATKLPDLSGAFKALAGLDAGSLVATVDRVRLSGVTANQAAADAANALQAGSADLVQTFVQGPAAAAPIAPGRLTVIKSPDGSITATGDVQSDESRADLIDALKTGNPSADISDRMAARTEGLDGGWADRARAGVKALSALDWGSLSLEGPQGYLNGMAPQDAIAGVAGQLDPSFAAAIAPRPDDPNAARISQLEAQISGLSGDAEAARAAHAAAEQSASGLTSELDAAKKRIEELLAQSQQPAPEPAPAPAPAASGDTAASCNTAVADILRSARIEFDSAKATIRPEGIQTIDALLTAAKPCISDPTLRVTVGGHTDSRGDESANQKLSQDRADAVKAELVSNGVKADDVTTIGFGESMPIADNATEDGRQANRRITIEWSLR